MYNHLNTNVSIIKVPELGEDVSIPDLCYTGEEEDIDINTWIGPKEQI